VVRQDHHLLCVFCNISISCVRNLILAVGSSGVTARRLPFPNDSWPLPNKDVVRYHEGVPQDFGNAHGKPSHNSRRPVERGVFERRVRPVHEGQSSQEYQRYSYNAEPVSSGPFLPRHRLTLNIQSPKERQRQESISILGATSAFPRQRRSIQVVSGCYRETARLSHIGFRARHRRPFEVSNQRLSG